MLRLALEGPIVSFDPALMESESERRVAENIFEPLLRRDLREGGVRPGAAESHKLSDDGKTIHFQLRKNLRWSNGEKILAKDFIYAWRRALDLVKGTELAKVFSNIAGVDDFLSGAVMDPERLGFLAKDDYTIEVKLKNVSPFSLDFFTHPVTAPVFREVVEKKQEAWTQPKNWVGNGAFYLYRVRPHFVWLKRNPHFHRRAEVQLEWVGISMVSSPTQGTQQFLERKIDQFGYRDFTVPVSRIPELANQEDLKFQPDLQTTFLRMNVNRAPLSQLKFRQALAMSVNRKLLFESIASENESMAFSMIPKGIKGYEPPRGYLFNVPGALKILRDLGYCVRGTRVRDCRQFPSLTMIHRDEPKYRKIALAIRVMWERSLGLTRLNLAAKREGSFMRSINAGKYFLALDDLAAEPDRAFDLLNAFQTGEPTAGGYSDSAFDGMLARAMGQPHWAAANGVIRQAEAVLLREGGVVPLIHGTLPILVSKKVRGFQLNVFDVHLFEDLAVRY